MGLNPGVPQYFFIIGIFSFAFSSYSPVPILVAVFRQSATMRPRIVYR